MQGWRTWKPPTRHTPPCPTVWDTGERGPWKTVQTDWRPPQVWLPSQTCRCYHNRCLTTPFIYFMHANVPTVTSQRQTVAKKSVSPLWQLFNNRKPEDCRIFFWETTIYTDHVDCIYHCLLECGWGPEVKIKELIEICPKAVGFKYVILSHLFLHTSLTLTGWLPFF